MSFSGATDCRRALHRVWLALRDAVSIPRFLPRLKASTRRRAKRCLHHFGVAACLLAIFISAGGHWAVLQSVAYTRMVVEFALEGPLSAAVKKAFDDRYACSLCPKIRHGCDNERKAPSKLGEMQQPELLVASGALLYFAPSVIAEVAFVASRQIDFSNGPPKPPPRAA